MTHDVKIVERRKENRKGIQEAFSQGFAVRMYSETLKDWIIMLASDFDVYKVRNQIRDKFVVYSPSELKIIKNYTEEQLKLAHMTKKTLGAKVIKEDG